MLYCGKSHDSREAEAREMIDMKGLLLHYVTNGVIQREYADRILEAHEEAVKFAVRHAPARKLLKKHQWDGNLGVCVECGMPEHDADCEIHLTLEGP